MRATARAATTAHARIRASGATPWCAPSGSTGRPHRPCCTARSIPSRCSPWAMTGGRSVPYVSSWRRLDRALATGARRSSRRARQAATGRRTVFGLPAIPPADVGGPRRTAFAPSAHLATREQQIATRGARPRDPGVERGRFAAPCSASGPWGDQYRSRPGSASRHKLRQERTSGATRCVCAARLLRLLRRGRRGAPPGAAFARRPYERTCAAEPQARKSHGADRTDSVHTLPTAISPGRGGQVTRKRKRPPPGGLLQKSVVSRRPATGARSAAG